MEWRHVQGKPQILRNAVWKKGDAATHRETLVSDCQTRIQRALQNEGFWSAEAKVETRLNSDQTQMHLVVAVSCPATPVVIDDIKVYGADRNTVAEILDCCDLAVGKPWNLETQMQAEAALYESGRFAMHRFVVNKASIRGGRCWLRLHVEEAPFAPPLKELLSEKDQFVIQTLKQLSRLGEDGRDVLLRIRVPLSVARQVFPVFGGPANAAAAEGTQDATVDKTRIVELLLASQNNREVLYGLRFIEQQTQQQTAWIVHGTAQSMSLVSLHGRKKWSLPNTKYQVPQIQIAGVAGDEPADDPKRRFSFKFGVQMTPRGKGGPGTVSLPVTTVFTPAFALHSARRGETKLEKEGDRTIVTADGVQAEVDPNTGDVRRIWGESEDGLFELRAGKPGTIPLITESFALLKGMEDITQKGKPLESLVDFLLTDIQNLPQLPAESRRGVSVVRKLTLNTLRHGLPADDSDLGNDDEEIEFHLPTAAKFDGSFGSNLVSHWWLKIDQAAFPRDSSFSRLGRELVALLILKDEGAAHEIAQLLDSSEAGPLLHLYCLETFGRICEPTMRQTLSRKGLARMNDLGFRADVRQVLRQEAVVGRLLTTLVQTVRELEPDELDLLLNWTTSADIGERRKCLAKLADGDRTSEETFLDVATWFWEQRLQSLVRARFQANLELQPSRSAGDGGASRR